MSKLDSSLISGVIVTGGASGIGRGCAEALAAAGRPVAIWDLGKQQPGKVAEQLSQTYGVPAVGLEVDVRSVDAIEQGVKATRECLPSIGGLVHAAGVVLQAPLGQVTEENWRAVLDVNLSALVFLVQAIRPDLKANPGSAVVGIASINATLGHGLIPAYSASKGGLLSLVKSLADDLANDGVRINALSPGAIRTPMLFPTDVDYDAFADALASKSMLGRLGKPEEIGAAVRFLLSEDASFITATELVVDGGAIPSQRS